DRLARASGLLGSSFRRQAAMHCPEGARRRSRRRPMGAAGEAHASLELAAPARRAAEAGRCVVRRLQAMLQAVDGSPARWETGAHLSSSLQAVTDLQWPVW